MWKLLLTSTAALLMSGSLSFAGDPAGPGDRHMQAIGAHAGLSVADVGYVPPEFVAAQRLATERRMQRLAAARSVADVGFVPPESRAPQPQERRRAAYEPVADVGYVPPEIFAAWRLSALREEQRLAKRLTALRQARRSFYRPIADVGYVPPAAVAAQGQPTSLASPAMAPAATAHALEIGK